MHIYTYVYVSINDLEYYSEGQKISKYSTREIFKGNISCNEYHFKYLLLL